MAKSRETPQATTIEVSEKTPLQLRQEKLIAVGCAWLASESANVKTVAESLEVIRPFVADVMNGLGVSKSETEAKFADAVYIGQMVLFGELVAGSELFKIGLDSLAFQNGVQLLAKDFEGKLFQYCQSSLKIKKVCSIGHADDSWRVIAMAGGLSIDHPSIKALRNVFAKLGAFLTELGYRQRKANAKAETAKAETAKAETTPPTADVVISKEITPQTIVSGVVGQSKFTVLDVVRQSLVEILKQDGDTPEWVAKTFTLEFITECEAVVIQSN